MDKSQGLKPGATGRLQDSSLGTKGQGQQAGATEGNADHGIGRLQDLSFEAKVRDKARGSVPLAGPKPLDKRPEAAGR